MSHHTTDRKPTRFSPGPRVRRHEGDIASNLPARLPDGIDATQAAARAGLGVGRFRQLAPDLAAKRNIPLKDLKKFMREHRSEIKYAI